MTLGPCVLFTAHWSAQTWSIVQWYGPHIQKEILISWIEYREERPNLSQKVMMTPLQFNLWFLTTDCNKTK